MDLGQAVPGQAVHGQAALKEWVEVTAGFGCSTSSLFLPWVLCWAGHYGWSTCLPPTGSPYHREQEQAPRAPVGVVFLYFPFSFSS